MRTIAELKKKVLLSKKEDKELSKAYAAVLRQVEAKTVGVVGVDLSNEVELILSAAKKELKEQEQSKKDKAPYSELVITICTELVEELGPKYMSKEETKSILQTLIDVGETNKGKLCGTVKRNYGDKIDMTLVAKILTELGL